MKSYNLLILVALLFTFSNNLQAGKAKDQGPVLITIDGKEVPVDLFKYSYEKNNGKKDNSYSKEDLDSYMELYKKFLLKVREAENQKLDTIQAFKREFEMYKKQLAQPYLTSDQFVDSLARQAYNRMHSQVKAAHLLIRIEGNADPADTLKAYNKCVEIKKEIQNGLSFEEAAIKYSDDPSANAEPGQMGYGGDLGYFSAFDMVYEFENAAFETPVGKISSPIRTQFGYHLVKVFDKRTNPGQVKVKHIMVKAPEGISTEDSLAAYNKIIEIRKKITEGADWNETAKAYSEHDQTKDAGGELRPFSLGGHLGVPEFEKAAFAMENEGDISEPVKSSYGWHIILLEEKQPIPPYSLIEDDIKKRVSRDSRSKLSQQALVNKLKKENKFKASAKTKEKLFASVDSTILSAEWKAPADSKLADKKLFSIAKEKYTVASFYTYLEDKQKKTASKNIPFTLEKYYNSFVDATVVEYEQDHLAEKYPEYSMLVKEYRDGILLFDLMTKEIWNKASEDTTGLKEFYNNNIDNYQWKERIEARIYSAESDSVLIMVKEKLKNGATEEEIKASATKISPLALQIKKGTYEKEAEEIQNIEWKANSEFKESKEDRSVLIITGEILPAGPKPLKEIKGTVISDYQNHLEKEWLKKLAAEYPITVNEKEFNALIK